MYSHRINDRKREVLDKWDEYIKNNLLSKLFPFRQYFMDKILKMKLLQWKEIVDELKRQDEAENDINNNNNSNTFDFFTQSQPQQPQPQINYMNNNQSQNQNNFGGFNFNVNQNQNNDNNKKVENVVTQPKVENKGGLSSLLDTNLVNLDSLGPKKPFRNDNNNFNSYW